MSASFPEAESRSPAQPTAGLVWFAFVLVYIFWGSTYLGIGIAVRDIPPAMMCAARFAVAGPLMLAWCALTRRRIRISLPEAARLATIGVLLLCAGNGMVAWGEQYTPTGIAALIVASVPLWVMLLERMLHPSERLSARGICGLLVGIAGIGLLLWPKIVETLRAGGLSSHRELVGAAGLMLASVSWSLGSIFSRHWQTRLEPIAATGWEMIFGAIANFTVALIFGQPQRAHWSARGLGAIAYLVVFGSWVGFTAYVWLLKHVPTTKVATYAYVNPIVAVLLGWMILHERVDGYVLAGTAVIVGAVALATTAAVKHRPPEPELPAVEQGAD
jgi:drug/metabolite transporter (DMT)-like permease